MDDVVNLNIADILNQDTALKVRGENLLIRLEELEQRLREEIGIINIQGVDLRDEEGIWSISIRRVDDAA